MKPCKLASVLVWQSDRYFHPAYIKQWFNLNCECLWQNQISLIHICCYTNHGWYNALLSNLIDPQQKLKLGIQTKRSLHNSSEHWQYNILNIVDFRSALVQLFKGNKWNYIKERKRGWTYQLSTKIKLKFDVYCRIAIRQVYK